MPFFLKVLAALDKELLGVKYPLKEGDNLIGRVSPPSDLVLDGEKVSRKHCVLKVKGSEISMEDKDSSNGVFVNGTKLMKARLKAKDKLVIGEFTLEVSEK